jgi:hypothetical protein
MKKGVNYIIILLLIVSVFFPVDYVYAGTSTVTEALGIIASWLGGGIELLLRPVFWAVQKILAGFAGLAGLILNSVIDFTIFRMSDNIQGLTGINIAWKVIKDLMNIGFIFMLVYQSILVILSIKDVSSVKSFIVGIFLASILINFSLFFTKVIIDASNVVTVGIYNNIVPGGAGQTLLTAGLANAYTQRLNIQSFYSADGASTATNWGQIMGYIGISIILIIVIFVFLAVSVMFLVRYIVLLILLVLSPIAYMGLAWSGMKSYADRWWNAFWGQILWPPVYMIMTWVVLTIISDQGFLGKRPEYASLGGLSDGASAQDAASVIVNFALIIGLTIASIVISKQTATKGAAEVGKLTSGAMALGGGALLGGAARLGRTTVGRYGERMASDEDLKRRADEEKGIKGRIARMQLAAANRAATGSYDVRASRAGKTAIEQTLGKEGFGKVAKDSNFRAIREAKIKEEAKIAERYKVSDRAKDEAKEKLDMNTLEGRKFDLEEKERKTKRRIYFGSDEFLNSSEKIKTDELAKESELEQRDIAREKAKIESDRASIEANKKEGGLGVLARLKNERDLAQGEKKAELDKKINDWEVDPDNQDLISGIKDQEDALREKEKEIFQREEVDRVNQEKVKKFYKEKKELDDDKWVSQEKLRLVAVAGGTETRDVNGEKVTFVKGTETRFDQAVVDAYSQRTARAAERAEEGSFAYRRASNVYSFFTGKKLKPTHYGKQLAKEIKKKSGGKTAAQQLRDLAKQQSEEDVAAGIVTEGTQTTQAPTPEPVTAPQPEQNAGGGQQA